MLNKFDGVELDLSEKIQHADIDMDAAMSTLEAMLSKSPDKKYLVSDEPTIADLQLCC